MPKVSRPRKNYKGDCALYHGDELVGIGTKKELAELIGVTAQTIYFYSSPSYRKRFDDDLHGYVVIELD